MIEETGSGCNQFNLKHAILKSDNIRYNNIESQSSSWHSDSHIVGSEICCISQSVSSRYFHKWFLAKEVTTAK